MHWIGFEPTIPVFDGTKIVHALDRAAIEIGVECEIDLVYGGRGSLYTFGESKQRKKAT
jgi:hypothetical protein